MTVELRAGVAIASVYPAEGGRLGQLEVDGSALLRGPEFAHEGWARWGSYPLLPWSNRVPDGTFTFEGRRMQVRVNWSDGTAIHGLAAFVPWSVERRSDASCALAAHITGGSYEVRGEQEFHLSPNSLDQTVRVTNCGRDRIPVGLGIHPWFHAGAVRVPADRYWPGSPLPDGAPVPVAEEEDLRVARVPPPMDRCYTALTDRAVTVGELTLRWSGPIRHVVVYTGEPGWVCIEPVTMVNNGFRLAADGMRGTGVIALEPGEAAEVAYRFGWA